MIAFGCAITRPEDYRRWADPGVRRAAEPDSEIFANSSPGSIFRAYNLLLELAAEHDDLEALVLLHQDVEIVDPDFCATVRATFVDPDVAVAGCVGALGVRSLAWWEGAVTWASFTHRYYEYGGGLLPAFAMDPARVQPPPYARLGEVDTIDGFIMAISPWAVRHLRFDESLGQFHGYDFDFCLQARAAQRKVVTADLKVVHHHSLELLADPDNWVTANIQIARKWADQLADGPEADWERRARRAEARASAANVARIAADMRAGARERELLGQLAQLTGSRTWRLTAPARGLAGPARRLTALARARGAAPGDQGPGHQGPGR